ncbi:gliding motility-associated C-terminal domain-containing protein [Spirosoma agri]|uniref:Gliding motility-associated C-terminal domain-containing protein n=1 Tax=Spirosoma agri TaxID=1987381 RepID=A0A6M0ISB4_9BACT|nr:gliding motility-associated C-terminal domain-containing protein [Spirosoma agri]NEU70922.1 gliding motility-associated C-terminal domain-containing protein [Spirosoma agri]
MIRYFITLVSVFTLCTVQATAQNGVFDVRLLTRKADCGNQKLLVDIELKAQNETTSFLMGNANFRFQYDAQFLQHPVLVEQHNFSSAAKTADRNYNPQTLNGSSERLTRGIVSLNVIYSGSEQGATTVGNKWVPVATVQFDMVNPRADAGTSIVWNDNNTFPITGLSEVVLKGNSANVDAYIVKASGTFLNLAIDSFAAVCNGLGSANTTELMIPEGFSPNGDGLNDRFILYNIGALKASLTVYNLSGAIVYTNDNYQNDWDGQSDGAVVASGTYFYNVRLSDGRSFQRSMTIIH